MLVALETIKFQGIELALLCDLVNVVSFKPSVLRLESYRQKRCLQKHWLLDHTGRVSDPASQSGACISTKFLGDVNAITKHQATLNVHWKD